MYKAKLKYIPETGEFIWIGHNKYNPELLGTIAGSINGDGYRHINYDGVKIKAHRLAWWFMTGAFPTQTIDHIDRDRDNNAWTNLREADMFLQNANTSIRHDNTSGYKGVNKTKNGKWLARVSIRKQRISLGTFTTPELAQEAIKNYV